MADISGASLGPIYDRLNSAPSYHPLEADTFADWSLEAGDIVTVTRDNKGYQSPVHSSVVTWKKQPQVQISSTGNEQREAISKMSQKKFRGGSSGLRANNYQHIYVDDAYGRMRSGLELTGSTATLYVDDKYKQMRSGLALTSSSAALYVEDRYRQMKSGLDLTSSSAALYVEDRYRQMKSGLDLTSSSAALYVDNKYNQMKAGLDLTSSSAAMYVRSKTTKAELILSITNGQSSAKLTADTIDIDGVVEVLASKTLAAEAINCEGTVLANAMDANHYYLSGDFEMNVYDAEVSGNTLTLYMVNGDPITFSKATSLSGSWSGRNYTVTAKQNDVTVGKKTGIVYDGLVPTGNVTTSGKTVYRDFIVYSDNGEGEADKVIMQKNIGINASSVYDADHSMYGTKYVSSSGSYVSTTSETIDPGGSVTIYPTFTKSNGTTQQRGTGVTITANDPGTELDWTFPSNPSTGTSEPTGTFAKSYTVSMAGDYSWMWIKITVNGEEKRLKFHILKS